VARGLTNEGLLSFNLLGEVRVGDALRFGASRDRGGDEIEYAPFLEEPNC
jgi:hypothetical protein